MNRCDCDVVSAREYALLRAEKGRLEMALAQIEQQAAHEEYVHAMNGRPNTANQFRVIGRIAEGARNA